MPVEVRCDGAAARRYLERLRAEGGALLRASGLPAGCELSILIVDDRAMRALNRGYRSHDRATDVLSFPQFGEDEWPRRGRRGGSGPAGAAARTAPPLPLGDVVISLAAARRQAAARGERTTSRLRTLLIHGFLHLLGYDHERSAVAARAMFARARELEAALEDRGGRGRAHRAPPRPPRTPRNSR